MSGYGALKSCRPIEHTKHAPNPTYHGQQVT